MNKIYVPITGAVETKKALNYAIRFAHRFNRELIAVNVIDRESISKLQRYKIFIEEESSMFAESLKKDAEKYLNYAKKLGEQEGVRVSTVLLEGDPFHELVEFFEKEIVDGDLIALSRRSEATIIKDLFGKIEKKLLFKTEFPFVICGGRS